MTPSYVECPLCGRGFDPAGMEGCAACPVAPGCRVTCCPACGYSWVEPERTTLGRWVEGWLGRRRRRRERSYGRDRTLAEVPPRWRARIQNCERLPDDRRRRLRAYGLTDGGIVEVIQQIPATVILLDRGEIALEADLARRILVEIVGGPDLRAPVRPRTS